MKGMSHEASKNRREKIAAAVKGGMTVSDAMAKFSVCRITVYQSCKENRVAPLGRRPRYDRAAAVEDLQRMSIPEVAQKHGISYSTASELRRINGLKAVRFEEVSTYAVLAVLLNSSDSCPVIAESFGVSRQAVHATLQKARKAGIRFPHRKERP